MEMRSKSNKAGGELKDRAIYYLRTLVPDETLQDANIKEIPVDEAEKKLGYKLPGVESICQIPNQGSGSCRYLALYANRELEYLPEIWSPRPYIPRKARKYFSDVKMELEIVESEFEALAYCEYDDKCAIAFPGLGRFSQKLTSLPIEFDQIELSNRDVTIYANKQWLDQAKESGRYETDTLNPATLVNKLNEKGAKACIFLVEAVNDDGTLTFIDDYDRVCGKTVEKSREK
jgi:hypothetical protein